MKYSKSSRFDFDGITARYDLINRLLSLCLDLGWRRQMAKHISPGQKVLDLCAGTGDVARCLTKKTEDIIACDISHEMCLKLKQKLPQVPAVTADALAIPFRDASFDAVVAAFGVRNFADLKQGFGEIRRILKENGKLVVLEFTRPEKGLSGFLRKHYLSLVVGRLGGLLSGRPDAYQYLASSIMGFMSVAEFETFLRDQGMRLVKTDRLSFNAATLFVSEKM